MIVDFACLEIMVVIFGFYFKGVRWQAHHELNSPPTKMKRFTRFTILSDKAWCFKSKIKRVRKPLRKTKLELKLVCVRKGCSLRWCVRVSDYLKLCNTLVHFIGIFSYFHWTFTILYGISSKLLLDEWNHFLESITLRKYVNGSNRSWPWQYRELKLKLGTCSDGGLLSNWSWPGSS